jgi:DNA repair photolyase
MIYKPIYVPKEAAKEYANYAINIYTECSHGCTYCWARDMARRFGKPWTGTVAPRKDIVKSVKRQLEREQITDKLIHLCFTCDPYPMGYDTTLTREIIKLLKDSGNHVQILTKGGTGAERDFDLLDSEDWVGITLSGKLTAEPNAADPIGRIHSISEARRLGIKTWISFEPVLDEYLVSWYIETVDCVDKIKIGKLNYQPSDINWKEFGRRVEKYCIERGVNYTIKDGLRKEMDK